MKTLNIISSDKANLRSTLSAGGNIAILVGGIREAERTAANEMSLCADRKGIFEIAIETGAEIIPTLCYGENEIFRVWKPLGVIQDYIKRWMHFTVILPYMSDIIRLVTNGCPHVKTYMGVPIRASGDDTVDTLRVKYMTAFDELYAATRPATYSGEKITWIGGPTAATAATANGISLGYGSKN